MPAAALAEDIGAPWHNTMLELAGAGIKEYPGGDDNPVILGWARHIGLAFPAQADYANLYKHDATAWCGVTMAEALARNGIEPPFGTTDTDRWMWANSFARPFFADKLDAPRRGCIAVFKWASGGGHVGTVDAANAQARTLDIVGGNQGDAVTRARFRWDEQLVGFFWPKKTAAAAAPQRTPADVRRRMGQAITLAEARVKDGKIAVYDLPAGDGGGAFEVAGINERYHPVMANKLKAMIEAGAPDADVRAAIGDYLGAYTDVADVWTSSWCVEFYLRDSVFHRGPTGAALILQIALKGLQEDLGETGTIRAGIDGEVGPLTAEAMRRQERDPLRLLDALRAARDFYERNGHLYIKGGPNRDETSQFWKGLVNRWNNQMVVARRFHAEQPKEGTMPPTIDQPQQPIPPTQPGPPIPGPLVPWPDLGGGLGVSQTLEQENRQLRELVMTLLLREARRDTGYVPPGSPATPPRPAEPAPPPPPAPVAPPTSSNTGLDLIAQLGALLVGGGAVVGGATGMVEPSTATTFGLSSLVPLIGGALGLFNPTLGRLFSGVAPLLNRWTAPAANPPTR